MEADIRKSAALLAIIALLIGAFITASPATAKDSKKKGNKKPKRSVAETQLISNRDSCKKILDTSIIFDANRATLPQNDFASQRNLYASHARFIDEFYYKTFNDVATTMGYLRDNVWQVADRSADMVRVLGTTQDPDEISDLEYAINRSRDAIPFDAREFASACRALPGFSYRTDVYTQS